MKKEHFLSFYASVIKEIGLRFTEEYPNFKFTNNPDSLYEEYLHQRNLLKMMYNKGNQLLDRHKVCACMTVAIIKIRLISNVNIDDSQTYSIMSVSRINEQLAFMSAWELFKGFISLKNDKMNTSLELPPTYHNASFLDTITRSLFLANQTNSLSVPLIANIFFLLEKYCEKE